MAVIRNDVVPYIISNNYVKEVVRSNFRESLENNDPLTVS
jgi:hypothetical protein